MSVAELQSYGHLSIKMSKGDRVHHPRSKDFQLFIDYYQSIFSLGVCCVSQESWKVNSGQASLRIKDLLAHSCILSSSHQREVTSGVYHYWLSIQVTHGWVSLYPINMEPLFNHLSLICILIDASFLEVWGNK